jgi:hypothetical protein
MYNPEQRLVELIVELDMLRVALGFWGEPADQNRISGRLSACIAEYTQVLDACPQAIIPTSDLLARCVDT